MSSDPVDVLLNATWIAGVGYRYDVILNGDVIVRRSRVPEHEAARALHARGFRGRFRTVDFRTGSPRMILDIETTARLRIVERSDTGPIVVPYRPMSGDVRALLGANTSDQGRAVPEKTIQVADPAAEAAHGEACAAPVRVLPLPAGSEGPALAPADLENA
jgi:hypothetical protein